MGGGSPRCLRSSKEAGPANHANIHSKQVETEMRNRKIPHRGTWLAQAVGHVTFDLSVMGLSPMLDVETT